MDKYEFPPRQFTLGQEPVPIKSIGYFSNDTKLFSALGEALNRDEWEELSNSRLGVFIKFHELEFGLASRLVHYMLTYQLDCKKKYELWSLICVRPVRFYLNKFEEITGLNCYLAIYVGFIEAQRTSPPTRASLARLVMDLEAFEAYQWGRVAFKFLIESVKKLDLTKTYAVEGFVEVLQVWIYNALPEYATGFGDPVSGATPPLLGFLGGKGRKNAKEKLQIQTRLNYYVVKDYSEMFPFWDVDVADEKADNIVKAVYAGGWVWDQTHWPVGGTKLWTNVKVEYQNMKTEGGQMNTSKTSKSSNRSKKARSSSSIESEEESRKKTHESPGLDMETVKAEIKVWLSGLTSTMVEGLSRCERALSTQSCMIISLTEKVEEVEKIVRGRGEDDCTKDGSYGDVHEEDKSVGDKDENDKAEDDKGENEQTEDDQAEESKAEETSPQVSRPGRKRRANTKEASPQGRQIRGNVKSTGSESETGGIEPSVVVLEKEQSDIDYGSVKKLKQVGKVKSACLLARAKSDRLRRLAPVNNLLLKEIALRRRHIVIWDSDVAYAKDEEIAKSVKPITHMLPYMLHMLSRSEDMELYMVDFTHERISASGVPQNTQSGDCGVYYLKYIECHALGMTFPAHDFCDKNVKLMRAKLAAEIFDETNINGTEKREYKNLAVYE
ncbi:hypothetical protein N665_0339s0087 [Sinapis alba]|nr:hypothetical protein N665_0339s0087 [Sinapis alba]